MENHHQIYGLFSIRTPLLSFFPREFIENDGNIYVIFFSPENPFSVISSIRSTIGPMCRKGEKFWKRYNNHNYLVLLVLISIRLTSDLVCDFEAIHEEEELQRVSYLVGKRSFAYTNVAFWLFPKNLTQTQGTTRMGLVNTEHTHWQGEESSFSVCQKNESHCQAKTNHKSCAATKPTKTKRAGELCFVFD